MSEVAYDAEGLKRKGHAMFERDVIVAVSRQVAQCLGRHACEFPGRHHQPNKYSGTW